MSLIVNHSLLGLSELTSPTFFGISVNPVDGGAKGGFFSLDVTPPSSMISGDIVLMMGFTDNLINELGLDATGGQTWTTIDFGIDSNYSWGIVMCIFNGLWTTNPSLSYSTPLNRTETTAMIVFRPSVDATWDLEDLTVTSVGTVIMPNALTIPDKTTIADSTLSVGIWYGNRAQVYSSFTGSPWTQAGSNQYRNLSAGDQSLAFCYQTRTSPGSLTAVSKTGNLTASWTLFNITLRQI